MKRKGRGRSQATIDLIDTSIKIIEGCQPISVRGVCYKLFVAGLISSMAVKNTQKISRILRQAREENQIPWEWIVDESRQLERQPAWQDLEAYSDAVAESYRRDFWADQEFRPILISEKSTVAGVLRPVLDQYGIPFFSAHGFNSATKIYDLAHQIKADSREYIFLYVGDYDPSGLYMSEVDFPERLKRYGAGVFNFERLAITLTQASNLKLPHFTPKKKDPRYDWYVNKRHSGFRWAWELDAMDPQELREVVREQIECIVDFDAWDRHQLIEQAQRDTTRMIAASFRGNDKGLNP